MKKFITVFISCSLALSAGALAQQDETSPAPGKKKQHEKAPAANAAQPPSAPRMGRPADRPHPAMKPREQGAERHAARPDAGPNQPAAAHARVKAPAPAESVNAPTDMMAHPGQHRKGAHALKAPATANETNPAGPAPAKARMQAKALAAPQASMPGPGAGKMNAQTKKPDVQTVKKIRAEHATFKAQAKPDQIAAVTFSQSRTISGADQWQGANYAAFRSYQPQMHDQNYYRSTYTRVELIGGGYYYFDAGYWYPAWGYQPSAQYYVYDGPIYAGRRAERLDRVIADVQAVLQTQGYYKGEVDGLLGPLTREALTGYQTDNGLYTTAAIDEPTLNSLGMD